MKFDLGEMKTKKGSSLRYEVEELASTFAIEVVEMLKTYPQYQLLRKLLKSAKVDSYLRSILKAELYPAARDLTVARWHGRQGQAILTVQVKDNGIQSLLSKIWPDKKIRLELISESRTVTAKRQIINLRQFAKGIRQGYLRLKHNGYFKCQSNNKAIIALEYSEGLDINNKSDSVWLPKSQINPSQVLVYFNKPVSEQVVKQMRQVGVRWVSLIPGLDPVWAPGSPIINMRDYAKIKPLDSVERWLFNKGLELLQLVDYWLQFHRQFNIKIHFGCGEGMPKYIAQSIAFDVDGKTGGYVVGKQRSAMFLRSLATLHHYNKDIFFTWSGRTNGYLLPHSHTVTNVVTGYPHDQIFKQKLAWPDQYTCQLKKHGAKFIVALFDNMHGPTRHFSTRMMERYYRAFFSWLLADRELGLIIKSKKTIVLDELPDIKPLLSAAEKTGRCLRLGDETKRLPLDAAKGADMSVGIGISSAVIESVIAGRRGLLCDLTGLKEHEFYQWGHNKIIFDDLEKLLASLKRYKENQNTEPQLGDWTAFLGQLDPFRDGRAGERMGYYLHNILIAFDKGKSRDEAIQSANSVYAANWGKENLICR